ncbi:hypothetical protein OIU77_019518 [Salix suchowensis]|uniref:Secreted protein n=1 Tax=Salix suchowensis TaxID=1278906 RepID=A0ABQ9CJE7_9ROSI|nr:hypothetical protein OIU77_019518 [Salix suchowensis]
MNFVALPPSCRILCHCPPATEFTAAAPWAAASAGTAFAAAFYSNFARLKNSWKTNFRANFARLAFMCVGWLRRNSHVEEVLGTLPQPRGLTRGSAGCGFGHPRKWAAEIYSDCHACQIHYRCLADCLPNSLPRGMLNRVAD